MSCASKVSVAWNIKLPIPTKAKPYMCDHTRPQAPARDVISDRSTHRVACEEPGRELLRIGLYGTIDGQSDGDDV